MELDSHSDGFIGCELKIVNEFTSFFYISEQWCSCKVLFFITCGMRT